MQERIQMLNTYIDNLSMKETVDLVNSAIKEKRQIHHTVVNAGKINLLQKDLILRQSVNSADIINADVLAVVRAAKFLGKPVKERVAGIDLMVHLAKNAAQNHQQIYLLGAKENVVAKLADIYNKNYGKDVIAGFRNGYFRKDEENSIIQNIANSGANLLFVAISSPKKENLLYKYREILKDVNFIMGVGGSFDVLTGNVKRAPLWMQKMGMEWFFRLAQEPKRMWKRYLIGNPKFILLVLKEKFKI